MKNEKLKKILDQFKIIFQKFPVTFITTVVLTIFYVAVFDTDLVSYKTVTNVTLFGIIFGFSSFFIESTFSSKTLKVKKILYIISAVLALILASATNYERGLFGLSNAKYLEYVYRFIICYIISIFVYSVYSLYKNKDVDMNEYLVKTAMSIFKSALIYGLLAMGLLLICLAFITLILDGSSYTLLARVEILLLGLFFIPRIFFALSSPEDEIGSFAKGVIKYVLGILVIVAFAVIYIYMLKIFILWQLPSNQIFRITAGLFIMGCPIWILVSYFKDKDLLTKINNILPYAFIPFIFLQMYSIGIRILEYGLTPSRYVCVAFIIFEIIYLVIHYLDKERLRAILYTLIAIILIAGLVPYINMFKLSEISQANIIKSALYSMKYKGLLTDKQKEKAIGAYDYLVYYANNEKLVNSLLTKEEKKALLNIDDKAKEEYKKELDSTKRLYGSTKIDGIDGINVEGYKRLYKISERLDKYSQETTSKNFNTFQFDVGDNRIVRGNIEPLINRYKEQKEDEFKEYFEKNNEYVVSDKAKVVLESFSMNFNKNTGEIDYCSFSGYILEK